MERQRQLVALVPTPNDLWAAVCAWEPDPLSSASNAALQRIIKLVDSSRFAPVPLDKLEGHMCALEPSTCLHPPEDSYAPSRQKFNLSHSNTFSTHAIRYADGHPSESEHQPTWKATERPTLQRFVSLGWVLMMLNGEWVKTGHALVLDADHNRHCHPWFVLAAEWETEDECYLLKHDTQIVRPPKKIKRDDSTTHGVLPNHTNRTPIAKLVHANAAREGSEKFVTHFGKDFNFEFDRMGKNPNDVRSPWAQTLLRLCLGGGIQTIKRRSSINLCKGSHDLPPLPFTLHSLYLYGRLHSTNSPHSRSTLRSASSHPFVRTLRHYVALQSLRRTAHPKPQHTSTGSPTKRGTVCRM